MLYLVGGETRRVQGLLGAAFCAIAGAFLTFTAPGLDLGSRDLDASLITGIALIASAGVLATLPWNRLPGRALLASPALVTLALAALGQVTTSVAESFLGLLTLSVVYLGLSQPPGTTTMALPFLVLDWWFAYPSHPDTVLVRLPLAITIWFVVGELIARATRRARAEATSLRSSALTDPLTQLGNRRQLDAQLATLAIGGAVVFLDLDRFKAFNDAHGHAAGDAILAQFAANLKHTLRAGDLVARYGGEEFVLLLPPTVQPVDAFNRIRAAWQASGTAVTFSAGATHRAPGENPAETMRRADGALYAAKRAGRDQLVVDLTGTELRADLSMPDVVTTRVRAAPRIR
jgi:diguanylate cyclase (GGDEF)-like protein